MSRLQHEVHHKAARLLWPPQQQSLENARETLHCQGLRIEDKGGMLQSMQKQQFMRKPYCRSRHTQQGWKFFQRPRETSLRVSMLCDALLRICASVGSLISVVLSRR